MDLVVSRLLVSLMLSKNCSFFCLFVWFVFRAGSVFFFLVMCRFKSYQSQPKYPCVGQTITNESGAESVSAGGKCYDTLSNHKNKSIPT